MSDVLEKLADLHKQATTPRNRYEPMAGVLDNSAVAATVQEAVAEIKRLREIAWMYYGLNK